MPYVGYLFFEFYKGTSTIKGTGLLPVFLCYNKLKIKGWMIFLLPGCR